MKKCTKCKKDLPEDKFGVNNKRYDGLQSECKPCRREINRKWYKNNKKRRRELNAKYKKKLQDFFIQVRDKPCMDCGIKYHWVVMDFDHVTDDKFMNLSKMKQKGYPIKKMKEEIKKCELVCSNCHRIRSFARAKALANMPKNMYEDVEIYYCDEDVHDINWTTSKTFYAAKDGFQTAKNLKKGDFVYVSKKVVDVFRGTNGRICSQGKYRTESYADIIGIAVIIYEHTSQKYEDDSLIILPVVDAQRYLSCLTEAQSLIKEALNRPEIRKIP